MPEGAALRSAKEAPAAPPFLFRDLVLAVATAINCGGGFGYRFVSDAGFVITILILLFDSRRWSTAGLAGILALCLLQPALMQAPPLIAALLLYANRPKHAVLALFASTLQLIGGFNPYFIPLALIPLVALICYNRWRPRRGWVIGAVVIFLIIDLLPALKPQTPPTGHQSFGFPYRIDVASRLGKADFQSTYTSIDGKGDPKEASVLVLEHDPPDHLATHNWTQKRLWPENYYFGASLFRIATCLDGFFYSNLGSRVDRPGIRLLGEAHGNEYNSFISKKIDKLVFSDSDFLNNGAVGYQTQLLQALFNRFSLAHAILLSSSLAALLGLFTCVRVAVLPIIVTASVLAVASLHCQQVDIRICDSRPIWPHSKGIAGMGAEVTPETGVMIVSKHGRARILGVARNARASFAGEKVIVMEGGAVVAVNGTIFEALDLPMGSSEGIKDAIPVRKAGSNGPSNCIVQFEGVTFIGTNSARSNWKRIYATAQ